MRVILDDVKYKDIKFDLRRCPEGRSYLQAWAVRQCTKARLVQKQKGRKWFLSKYMTKSELVQTAFKAVLTYEEHEVRESFKYKDQAIYGPHFNVDVLAQVCAGGVHTDKREEKSEPFTITVQNTYDNDKTVEFKVFMQSDDVAVICRNDKKLATVICCPSHSSWDDVNLNSINQMTSKHANPVRACYQYLHALHILGGKDTSTVKFESNNHDC